MYNYTCIDLNWKYFFFFDFRIWTEINYNWQFLFITLYGKHLNLGSAHPLLKLVQQILKRGCFDKRDDRGKHSCKGYICLWRVKVRQLQRSFFLREKWALLHLFPPLQNITTWPWVKYVQTRSLGALRAPTSRLRPFGPAWWPRNSAMILFKIFFK